MGEDRGIRKEERERKWINTFLDFQRQLWVISIRVDPYVMCVSRVTLFRNSNVILDSGGNGRAIGLV